MDEKQIIAALSALAQGTRLSAYRLIVEHAPRGLAAGEAARRLKVPQNTLSTHLAQLARAGLLFAHREGRTVIYRADMTRMRAVVAYLVNDCCGERPELCGPLIADIVPCCSSMGDRP